MQVVFTYHARKRCRQRCLDIEIVRSIIKAVPPCHGTTRFEVEAGLYAVFHDMDNVRHVVTVYRKGEGIASAKSRSKRELRRKGRKRNDWMESF